MALQGFLKDRAIKQGSILQIRKGLEAHPSVLSIQFILAYWYVHLCFCNSYLFIGSWRKWQLLTPHSMESLGSSPLLNLNTGTAHYRMIVPTVIYILQDQKEGKVIYLCVDVVHYVGEIRQDNIIPLNLVPIFISLLLTIQSFTSLSLDVLFSI